MCKQVPGVLLFQSQTTSHDGIKCGSSDESSLPNKVHKDHNVYKKFDNFLFVMLYNGIWPVYKPG